MNITINVTPEEIKTLLGDVADTEDVPEDIPADVIEEKEAEPPKTREQKLDEMREQWKKELTDYLMAGKFHDLFLNLVTKSEYAGDVFALLNDFIEEHYPCGYQEDDDE